MKKYLCIISAFMILTFLIASCGPAKPSSNASGASRTVSAPGIFPITNVKVTLKVFATPDILVEDIATNATTKWLEEKTNVHIDWQVSTPQDAGQKISLLLASQSDLPDVFFTSSISVDQMFAYGEQGVLIDLNKYIDSQGVNAQKLFAYDPMLKKRLTSPTGQIYTLPNYSECFHCLYAQKLWINTTWLDNLGLKRPDTTEEFYNVLKVFRDSDANKNKDLKDEIPLASAINGWNTTADNFIMNSFEYNSGARNGWLALDNGKVYAAYTTNGWKEGLKYLKRLYSEGLLDKEAFVMNTNQLRVLTGDVKGNRVGAFIGASLGEGVDLSLSVRDEYDALAPLKGPDGTRQAPKYPADMMQRFFITKACTIPEIAFKWGDMFQRDILADVEKDDFTWMPMWYGTEGVSWEKAKPGDVGLDGRPAKYNWLFSWSDQTNDHWRQYIPGVARADWKAIMGTNPNVFDQERLLFVVTSKYYKPYEVSKMLPALSFSQDDAVENGQLRPVLRDYVNECMAKFVTGKMDINTEWDKYLGEIEKMGVKRVIELAQKAYDNQYK